MHHAHRQNACACSCRRCHITRDAGSSLTVANTPTRAQVCSEVRQGSGSTIRRLGSPVLSGRGQRAPTPLSRHRHRRPLLPSLTHLCVHLRKHREDELWVCDDVPLRRVCPRPAAVRVSACVDLLRPRAPADKAGGVSDCCWRVLMCCGSDVLFAWVERFHVLVSAIDERDEGGGRARQRVCVCV